MHKIEIMLLVAVVEIGELGKFSLEDLSEFWSALTVCRDDKEFFALFNDKEQQAVRKALEQVETELRHRHKEPVNFFQLMQENPAKVEFYLRQFSLAQLLDLEADLREFDTSQVVADFIKLVKRQIYRLVPVA
ncbi:MAG: hypothetical protein IJ218_00800 [Alphaproteobacteria bacterium]|nr:hypothetical protein [Alphaproteobacteria bacterium]